ncbi:MAG: hypothetical protein HY840_15490 [Bacteroidetes bacterium]|nr:hypothetical protein [Bacteroidota bacterium]
MNIRKALLKEHSKRQAVKISRYACQSKSNFKELIQCYLSDNYVLAQRAGYSVSIAGIMQPSLISPYIKELIAVLSQKNVHGAVIRNSLRVLEIIEIPEKYHGRLMQICFQFLEDHSTSIAIKAYSMTIISNLSKKYPEIKSELKLIIEAHWEQASPGFKSRGRKILSEIKKGIKNHNNRNYPMRKCNLYLEKRD